MIKECIGFLFSGFVASWLCSWFFFQRGCKKEIEKAEENVSKQYEELLKTSEILRKLGAQSFKTKIETLFKRLDYVLQEVVFEDTPKGKVPHTVPQKGITEEKLLEIRDSIDKLIDEGQKWCDENFLKGENNETT